MFAQDFLLRRLSVKGEVSNCKYHSSGHIYFTLKDGGGTLQAVMFASQRRGLNFKLAEGQQVVVKGTVGCLRAGRKIPALRVRNRTFRARGPVSEI